MGDSEFDMSESPSKLARKLISIHDLEKYCKPQQLCLYNPVDSGFKYNIIGLFGMPDAIDPSAPCVYTVLSSLFPPAEPYKPKPYNTMLGANFFADIDFDRTSVNAQFFKQVDDVEHAGIILKLEKYSVLIFDIKKFDLKTGEMSDYGFAIQPLMHTLKNRDYLIGGRYQMPVMRGSVPDALRRVNKMINLPPKEQPRNIFKAMLENGSIRPLGNMQIVSQVNDLHPPEVDREIVQQKFPSMLHHWDKTDLERLSLEEFFETYDGDGT